MDSKTKFEQMRALLREEAEKKNSNGKPTSSGGDNASYPIFKIPENTFATARFLPDADDNNPWFWVERQIIRLPFNGIVGGDYPTSNSVTVTVPCVDMFHDVCPIIQHTKSWWRDVNGAENPMKEVARTYYKKRSYITSGFVVSSPFEEASLPENPIRQLVFGPGLLARIKAGLQDPDIENNPTDYLAGCDFRIRKTKKQDYNNYDTSEWARRSRSLTEAEHIAIEQYKLFDLKQFLGQRPDADGIAMIKAMFLASLKGEPFDYNSFGAHYRPYGGDGVPRSSEEADAIDSAVRPSVQTFKAGPSKTEEQTSAPEGPISEGHVEAPKTEKPLDILAKIKGRSGYPSNNG